MTIGLHSLNSVSAAAAVNFCSKDLGGGDGVLGLGGGDGALGFGGTLRYRSIIRTLSASLSLGYVMIGSSAAGGGGGGMTGVGAAGGGDREGGTPLWTHPIISFPAIVIHETQTRFAGRGPKSQMARETFAPSGTGGIDVNKNPFRDSRIRRHRSSLCLLDS